MARISHMTITEDLFHRLTPKITTKYGAHKPKEQLETTLPLYPNDSCAICNKPEAKACSLCKSIHYCSTNCQKVDFPTHKDICKQLPTFGPKQREEKELRIILQPDHFGYDLRSFNPEIEQEGEENDSARSQSFLDELRSLFHDKPFQDLTFKYNVLRRRVIPVPLRVWLDEKSSTNVGLWNKTLWCAFRNMGFPTPSNLLMIKLSQRDLTARAFRDAVDCLIMQTWTDESPFAVRGVKVACVGERKGGKRQFELVEHLSRNNLEGTISLFTKFIGCPLEVSTQGFNLTSPNSGPQENDKENAFASALMVSTSDISTQQSEESRLAQKWFQTGTVHLFRDGVEDLSMAEAKKICCFCRFKLQPRICQARDAKARSSSNSSLLNSLTPDILRWIMGEGLREGIVEDFNRDGDELVQSMANKDLGAS